MKFIKFIVGGLMIVGALLFGIALIFGMAFSPADSFGTYVLWGVIDFVIFLTGIYLVRG